MEYVIYQGQLNATYELLHNGNLYYIPFTINEQKAHKILDRQERNERMWEWMQKNDWLLGWIFVVVGTAFVVWWGM